MERPGFILVLAWFLLNFGDKSGPVFGGARCCDGTHLPLDFAGFYARKSLSYKKKRRNYLCKA